MEYIKGPNTLHDVMVAWQGEESGMPLEDIAGILRYVGELGQALVVLHD